MRNFEKTPRIFDGFWVFRGKNYIEGSIKFDKGTVDSKQPMASGNPQTGGANRRESDVGQASA
jgi:hypothetical protein